MKKFKTESYLINPSKEQKEFIEKQIKCNNYIIDWGLNILFRLSSTDQKVYLNRYKFLSRELTKYKKTKKGKFLNEVSRQSLDKALDGLSRSWYCYVFYDKPQPAYSTQNYRNFCYFVGVDIKNGKVKIPKINELFDIQWRNGVPKEIKSVHFDIHEDGKIYIALKVRH